MNQNFADTIYLFACSARGVKPETDHIINFEEVYKISRSQGIHHTVYLAAKQIFENADSTENKEIFKIWENDYFVATVFQLRKQYAMHNIIKKLEDNGIECCILKGESVARLYHSPIARVSSDTDMLVSKEDLPRCLKLLKDNGFEVETQRYESYHVECRHPMCGLVEVHTKLYTEKTEEISFNNAVEYWDELTVFKCDDGFEIKTLGITDNALFLFMHFIKHFLSEGAGLRQLCDFLLYIERFYNDIDWERLGSIFKKLSFDYMYNCMIFIGRKYFKLSEKIKYDPVDEAVIEKIFKDIEEGGVFGHSDKSRVGFYDVYLEQRYKRFNSNDISSYQTKKKIKRLFPNRAFMEINHPYVKKTVLLLPVSWVHRILKGVFRKKVKSPISDAHKNRLAFLKELNMV